MLARITDLAVLVGAVLLVHSWYPVECCNGNPAAGDCHPVPCDSLTEDRAGIHWHGLLFKDKQIRPSQDQGCHVCATDKPYCVFIQPQS